MPDKIDPNSNPMRFYTKEQAPDPLEPISDPEIRDTAEKARGFFRDKYEKQRAETLRAHTAQNEKWYPRVQSLPDPLHRVGGYLYNRLQQAQRRELGQNLQAYRAKDEMVLEAALEADRATPAQQQLKDAYAKRVARREKSRDHAVDRTHES